MDISKVLKEMKPDFAALSKIDFSKPQIQKDNKMWLILAGCAVAALIFCFFPAWWDAEDVKSYNAFGAWYSIFAFLGVLVAVASVLYGQYKLAFWAGIFIALMALLGCFMSPDADEMEQAKATFESVMDGYEPSGADDDVLDNVKMRLDRMESVSVQ